MVYKEEIITRYPEELIIENPRWVRLRHRTVHNSIVALIWILWAYLWLPLITVVGWGGKVWFTWDQMVEKNGLAEFYHLLVTWGWVLLALNALFIIWAFFNYFHYRKRNRRKARPSVTLADVANYHQKDLHEIQDWWYAKTMIVQHHENGVIASINLA
jgi:poly-beta-1,6-N-acetyl-D-glucosamine biosynthesis protein PgaD